MQGKDFNSKEIKDMLNKARRLNAEARPEEPIEEHSEILVTENTEGAVTPYIGLNGIQVLENGQVTKSSYFKALQTQDEKYADIKFTPEEAKRVSLAMRHLSTGINASVPLTCTGNSCPFASSCPYVEINKAPVGRPCLVEKQLINYWTEQFIDEFDVNMENITEVHLVAELAEFNIYEMRITKYLAEKHPTLMQDVVVSIDHTGEAISNQEVSRAFDLKEKIKRNRMKVLEALMATRKEKIRLKIETSSGTSTTAVLSELKRKLEEYRDEIRSIEPIKGKEPDEE